MRGGDTIQPLAVRIRQEMELSGWQITVGHSENTGFSFTYVTWELSESFRRKEWQPHREQTV